MEEILFVIFIICVFIELFYTPRIETTRERDVILWYTGEHGREYIYLFKF